MNGNLAEGSGDTGLIRRFLRDQQAKTGNPASIARLPVPPTMTPERAAATAIGRAAQRLYHLNMQAVSVKVDAVTQADLAEHLPDQSLLALLQGPGDLLGLMALCPQTLAALIEVQALGRVTNRPVEPRKLTRSDAMFCAEFTDALMANLGEDLSGLHGLGDLNGYHYAGYLDDPRPLGLMLEDQGFLGLAFDLEIGADQTRRGRIFVALPHLAEVGQQPASATKQLTSASEPATKDNLSAMMQQAPVDLIGILCRRRISLGALRNLAPGQVLDLPRVDLTQARIETPGGQLLAMGKFGEVDGCHAIRLADPLRRADPTTKPEAGTTSAPTLSFAATDPASIHPDPIPLDLTDPDIFRQPHLTDREISQNVTETAFRTGLTG